MIEHDAPLEVDIVQVGLDGAAIVPLTVVGQLDAARAPGSTCQSASTTKGGAMQYKKHRTTGRGER